MCACKRTQRAQRRGASAVCSGTRRPRLADDGAVEGDDLVPSVARVVGEAARLHEHDKRGARSASRVVARASVRESCAVCACVRVRASSRLSQTSVSPTAYCTARSKRSSTCYVHVEKRLGAEHMRGCGGRAMLKHTGRQPSEKQLRRRVQQERTRTKAQARGVSARASAGVRVCVDLAVACASRRWCARRDDVDDELGRAAERAKTFRRLRGHATKAQSR
eukprot:6205938-Pleurochrysis_carterae.AAC.1